MPADVHLPLDRLTLDLRSPAGRPFDGASRLLSNFIVQENGGLRRLGGWPRLGYADTEAVNQDLHDQMLTATGSADSIAEPVTMLFESKPSKASRRIVAATRSRIYVSGGLERNWRCFGWGFGGGEARPEHISDATRFYAAELGDIITLTNGLDVPMWTSVGKEPGTNGMSVEPIDDLIAMAITSAKVVSTYRGFMFLANVVMEGTTYRNRVIWSDFNDPLTYTPLPGSLAGMVDLADGEEVLRMEELGGSLRCYTTHSIYEVMLVGGEEIFNFRHLWSGPEVLRYRNSLINTGAHHLWVGEDRMHFLTETDRRPRSEEWLYAASGAIFNGLKAATVESVAGTVLVPFGPVEKTACENVVGGFDDIRKTAWLSWPTAGFQLATVSMVLHVPSQRACLSTRGFSAFLTHSKAYRESVRYWLARQGICEPAVLPGEGNPAPYVFQPIEDLHPEMGAPPLYIRNPAECSGLVPGYAKWLAEQGWCDGRPVFPPVATSAFVRTEIYLSEYVIRPSGATNPDELMTEDEAARLRSLVIQQYRYWHPTARVMFGRLHYVRSSVGASLVALNKSSGDYVADQLSHESRAEWMTDYWAVTASMYVSSSINPLTGTAPYPFVIDFHAKDLPTTAQWCADQRLNELITQWNDDPDKLPIQEVGPRTWGLSSATSTPGGGTIGTWRAKIEYLVSDFNCVVESDNPEIPNWHDAAPPLNPYYYPPGTEANDYWTLVVNVDPAGPDCNAYLVDIVPPASPIVQGQNATFTAVPSNASGLPDSSGWIYAWELSNPATGSSEIVGASGSSVTIKLGDTTLRILKVTVTVPGCAAREFSRTVQALEIPDELPPPCPTATTTLNHGTWYWGQPFTVTAVVAAGSGMTSSNTWTYTWTLTNTVAGVSQILNQTANQVTVKIADTNTHILTCQVNFGLPACPYAPGTVDLTAEVQPTPTIPCDCQVHERSVCGYLDHPSCDECTEGWVFVAASADFLCPYNVPVVRNAPLDPEYSLKQFEPLVLRWDYYLGDQDAKLAWNETNHPTSPMTADQYLAVGYASMAQVDSVTFGTESEKRVLRATAEFDSDNVADVTSAYLHAWLGTGAQAGQLMWQDSAPRRVDRLSLRVSSGHIAANTRPARLATYNFYRAGAHVAFRLILGTSTGEPITGGAVALNWMKANVLGARKDYF